MRRFKPAPDSWSELSAAAPGLARPPRAARLEVGRWLGIPTKRPELWQWPFVAAWFLISLPFRLVFAVFSLLGRIAGVAVGFALMVFGAALSAGPLAIIGIPVFLFGLLLSMRSLG